MNESFQTLEAELHDMFGMFKYGHIVPKDAIKGLTPTEGTVLMQIARFSAHAGRAPRVGDVVRSTHVSPSALSQQLRSLEDKGLISRERDEDDSRKVSLHLTETGSEAAQEGMCFFRTIIDALEEHLGEDDLRELVRILKRIDEFFRNQIEEGSMVEQPHEGAEGPVGHGGRPCSDVPFRHDGADGKGGTPCA
jgi:DNA-binding MarR family transcriptional regulator